MLRIKKKKSSTLRELLHYKHQYSYYSKKK